MTIVPPNRTGNGPRQTRLGLRTVVRETDGWRRTVPFGKQIVDPVTRLEYEMGRIPVILPVR